MHGSTPRSPSSDELLKVSDLHTYFYLRQGVLKAVSGVDLALGRREILGIVGESACGKSTLGLSLLRLVRRPGRISRGKILFRGEDLLEKDERAMREVRGNQISMIFQDPVTFLNPSARVGDQIAEGILLHKGGGSRRGAFQEAVEMLKAMGIPSPSDRARAYPHQLSGGMCQRVMIAMALCCEPDLLIADEPTTALDVTVQAQILELIRQTRERRGASVILITHDLGIVARMCDSVGIMYAGRIVEYGPVRVVFKEPAHPYTRGLLNSIPRISKGRGAPLPPEPESPRRSRLRAIPGQPPDLLRIQGGECPFLARCPESVSDCAAADPVVKNLGPAHWFRCFR
jgi:oligopeptide/dipeptide ABC transporter ATP-binding protein